MLGKLAMVKLKKKGTLCWFALTTEVITSTMHCSYFASNGTNAKRLPDDNYAFSSSSTAEIQMRGFGSGKPYNRDKRE